MKIRIKFQKHGAMKFIGHLDMMRYFQKCMRRADIDIAYSEGFHPHQIMSFAAPLGVGITSSGEYLDIQVNSTQSSEQSLRALNEVMAEGIAVVSYRKLKEDEKKAMSIVAAAEYKVWVKDGAEVPKLDYEAALEAFFRKPKEILITKKTKKSETVIDLKKLIYEIQIQVKEDKPVYFMRVSAGSANNLKPELVISSFYEFMGLKFDPLSVQIHRVDVYGQKNGALISLGEMGEIIG